MRKLYFHLHALPLLANRSMCFMADPAEEAPAGGGTPLGQQVGPEVQKVIAEAPSSEEEVKEDALPEGFDSWEAYGKAVAKGEVKAPTAKEEPNAEAEQAAIDPELKAEIDKLPEAVREKATPLFKEFADTGTLTPESKRAAAEAFGVTEEMVDLYMAGAKTSQEGALAPMYEAAGGKEAYKEFSEWAQTGMTPEEQAEFNAELDKGPEAAKAMIAKGVALWKEQGGGAPARDVTLGKAHKGAGDNADVYASKAEMQADMNNPKYSKDPAFRKRVEQKLGRSNI